MKRLIAALLLAAATLVGFGTTASATTPVVVTQLSLTPDFIGVGQHATGAGRAAVALHTDSPLTVQTLVVAVRDAVGNNVDFPDPLHNVTINGDFYYQTGERTFAGAEYREYASYQLDGVWHALPAQELFVAGLPH